MQEQVHKIATPDSIYAVQKEGSSQLNGLMCGKTETGIFNYR